MMQYRAHGSRSLLSVSDVGPPGCLQIASALLLAPRRSAHSGDEFSLPGVPDMDANTTGTLWH